MIEHILSFLIWFPLISSIFILLIPRNAKNSLYLFSIMFSLINFIVSLYLWKIFSNVRGFQFEESLSWIPSLGISYHVGVDGISLFLIILTAFLTPIVIISSYREIKDRLKEYLFSFFVLETAIIGSFLALDLFLFFVFWELSLIPMYIIIGIWGSDRKIYASIKFIIYTMLGSVLMLFAIIFLVISYKKLTNNYSFSYLDLKNLVLPLKSQLLLFILFSIAFAIKVPMFPFHTWLPDAHVEAPTAGSVFLAALLLKMGAYGFIRFALPLFPYAAHLAIPTLSFLAIIGIIYGGIVAWRQQKLKTLIAYSSISHMGFVVLGIFAIDERGVVGSVYQMLNHGITTGALFLLVGMLYERKHSKMIDDFGGIARVMPVYATFFMIATLSSIALPGLNVFVGEFMILFGTFQSQTLSSYNSIFGIAACFGMVISAIYMLGMYMRVFFGNIKTQQISEMKDLTKREIIYIFPLIILMIVMGLFPNIFIKIIKPSVLEFQNQYIETALDVEERSTNGFGSFRQWNLDLPEPYLRNNQEVN